MFCLHYKTQYCSTLAGCIYILNAVRPEKVSFHYLPSIENPAADGHTFHCFSHLRPLFFCLKDISPLFKSACWQNLSAHHQSAWKSGCQRVDSANPHWQVRTYQVRPLYLSHAVTSRDNSDLQIVSEGGIGFTFVRFTAGFFFFLPCRGSGGETQTRTLTKWGVN